MSQNVPPRLGIPQHRTSGLIPGDSEQGDTWRSDYIDSCAWTRWVLQTGMMMARGLGGLYKQEWRQCQTAEPSKPVMMKLWSKDWLNVLVTKHVYPYEWSKDVRSVREYMDRWLWCKSSNLLRAFQTIVWSCYVSI